MQSFQEFLVEAFTTIFPWHVTHDDADDKVYRFKVDNREGVVHFSPSYNNIVVPAHLSLKVPEHEVNVIFTIGYEIKVTGQGENVKFSIFATVIDIMRDYIRTNNPYRILFSADKIDYDGKASSDTSRSSLYSALIKKFASNAGYILEDERNKSTEVEFVLRRK